KNISPPSEQGFNQSGTPLQIETFGKRLVIFFSFFEPDAVGRIPIARFLAPQRFIGIAFNLVANQAEQTLKCLSQSIGVLNIPVLLTSLRGENVSCLRSVHETGQLCRE